MAKIWRKAIFGIGGSSKSMGGSSSRNESGRRESSGTSSSAAKAGVRRKIIAWRAFDVAWRSFLRRVSFCLVASGAAPSRIDSAARRSGASFRLRLDGSSLRHVHLFFCLSLRLRAADISA